MSIVALAGHVSSDTAHLTFAYPFGRTRCIRREWIEQATSSARGQSRFVTQTTVKAFNVAYTDWSAANRLRTRGLRPPSRRAPLGGMPRSPAPIPF